MIFHDSHNSLPLNDDDILVFEDDEIATPQETAIVAEPTASWQAMIVDDEPLVHQATKLALKGLTFEGKALTFLSAYSGAEAKQLMADRQDIAFILLDVVMETNDAGLRVVRYIREELNNQRVRVILRTGQPGEALEESVILDYDINDYKLKVEITRQKLITIAIAALRSYRIITIMEEQTTQLIETLHSLQQTQIQLVQSEKMSALGNLVAGVAHEINNPLGFISGNLSLAQGYMQDLFNLINLYQQHYPKPVSEISDEIEAIDLEYVREDLPKLISSMKQGVVRIHSISNSLRTFSRADTEQKISFNIHDGLDSTILILKYRLKANRTRPDIEVVKDYGNLPTVECYPGQLNQVFMNILANAIDALEESLVIRHTLREAEVGASTSLTISTIWIDTALNPDETGILIRISDNGVGMSEEVRSQIFDSSFTTKAVGKGTGLGLAIARQIVVEKHGGTLEVNSVLGQGTEFVITIPL